MLELPYDRVIQQFFDEHPEWKTSTAVVERYDRQASAPAVGFTAAALDALLQYVPAGATCLSLSERHFYATTLQWLIEHGVSRVVHTPYRQANAPETLPGQLGLFD